MAILITEDGAVRYVNENDVNRTMFPNLTGAMGDEQYDALNGRLVVVEGKVSDLQDCCDNVNNEITQLNEDLSKKASIISDTASGAIASFPDGAEGNASEIVVGIEPVQDLNGYDNPWPAGGGENILDPNIKFTAGTYYDTTLATNDGYTCTRSGTATSSGNIQSNTIAIDDAIILPAGTYTSTGAIFGLYNASGSWLANKQTGTWTVDESFYVKNVYIQVVSGTVYANTFFISLASGSTACSAWTPYSNICPITGWTGANVVRTGVNVWDEEWELGAYNADGTKSNVTDRIRCKNFIPISGGASYYFKAPSGVIFSYLFYDVDKTPLQTNIPQTQVGAVTAPSNAAFMLFYTSGTYGTTYNHNISINYPATDTNYHAYNGSSVSVDWTTEAGTVYGGTLNVTTGVLTVEKISITLDGTTDKLKFTNDVENYGNNTRYAVNYTSAVPQAKYAGSETYCKCSALNPSYNEVIGISPSSPPYHSICPHSGKLYVCLPRSEYVTTADGNSFLQSNPTQVCYELLTPLTYQLTPTEVKTLLGDNNIWADTGDVEVEYRADTKLYILKKIAEALA